MGSSDLGNDGDIPWDENYRTSKILTELAVLIDGDCSTKVLKDFLVLNKDQIQKDFSDARCSDDWLVVFESIMKEAKNIPSKEKLEILLEYGFPKDVLILCEVCNAQDTVTARMLLDLGWNPEEVKNSTAAHSCPEIEELLGEFFHK